ncbi:hypothetical protein FOCC_FOCC016417 [Frankliniella occidentalis]|nr:hypothetical protein FOCC_FOCC016417 [Frankliniella occidentalis]
MLLPPVETDSDNDEFRETILSHMNYDEVFTTILTDATILSYGRKLFQDLTDKNSPNRDRVVKDKMRELGRLMVEVKKLSPSTGCITELFCATKYRLVVEAGRAAAKYHPKGNKFMSASYVLKLKMDLMDISSHYIGKCLDDFETHRLVEPVHMFRGRLEREWSSDCGKLALRTLEDAKWNKVKRLPLAEDIKTLHIFFKKTAKEALLALKKDPSKMTYRKLVEVTLCQVMVLNRRRPGECQFMEVEHYNNSSKLPEREDKTILNSLTEMEMALCQRLQLIYIRGKRGRGVPIILTTELQDAVKLLQNVREKVGVPTGNNYQFPALNSSTGAYRAGVVLKNMTNDCPGLKDPDSIKGTELRKHIATMMQLLNLKENELDSVATFLGHNIDIHRHYYRLQESTIQLAKVQGTMQLDALYLLSRFGLRRQDSAQDLSRSTRVS